MQCNCTLGACRWYIKSYAVPRHSLPNAERTVCARAASTRGDRLRMHAAVRGGLRVAARLVHVHPDRRALRQRPRQRHLHFRRERLSAGQPGVGRDVTGPHRWVRRRVGRAVRRAHPQPRGGLHHRLLQEPDVTFWN